MAAFVLAVRDVSPGRAGWLGLVAGWAFFLPLLHWLSVLGWDAWLALALAIGGWYAAMGWAVRMVSDLRWWPLAVPAVWVLQEWLRSRFPWGGLGWGRLAFGQPDSPLTGWVTLGGAPLLSFVVVLAGCLLVWAAGSRVALLSTIAALTGLIAVGTQVYPAPASTESPASSQLAVIQGNVPQPGIDFLGRPLAVLTNHQRTTVELAAAVELGDEPQPEAVIWPENSSRHRPAAANRSPRPLVQSAPRPAIGGPVLVGAVLEVPGRPGPTPRTSASCGNPWTGPSDGQY